MIFRFLNPDHHIYVPIPGDHAGRNTRHGNPECGHEYLRLMSACHHFIIANSIFNWWDTLLAQSPDKNVAAALKRWGNGKSPMDDPVPADWQRL